MALKFQRKIKDRITHALTRGKSILLLGARQTGKTTIIQTVKVTKRIDLLLPKTRQQYEMDPERLLREITSLKSGKGDVPLIAIDEIQLVPLLLDVCQYIIDKKLAQFILSGSSARKIKARADINLLPGRVVYLRLDPLNLDEHIPTSLQSELYFGALPGITLIKANADRTEDLKSYVETYLEEEIRKETQIRNLASFARFLSLAAISSGEICNYSSIASQCGVSSVTVQAYFEVLVDCLICERILPLSESSSRKRLTKSPRYFFFDLGVRRIAAGEGEALGPTTEGHLFEQFVGLQILRMIRSRGLRAQLHFWNDPSGPEVDFIVKMGTALIPIEVKFSHSPKPTDARHIFTFMNEYPEAKKGFVVCQAEDDQDLSPKVKAINWKSIGKILDLLS